MGRVGRYALLRHTFFLPSTAEIIYIDSDDVSVASSLLPLIVEDAVTSRLTSYDHAWIFALKQGFSPSERVLESVEAVTSAIDQSARSAKVMLD